MKIGQLVMLVGCDDFMPPLGAVGKIVGRWMCVGITKYYSRDIPAPSQKKHGKSQRDG